MSYLNDYTGLHDVMVDTIENRVYSDDEVIECFYKLPPTIQDIAYSWGGNDTVFRDEAYRYIVKNIVYFKKEKNE